MAQVYVGTEGSQVVPGATASIAVQPTSAGTATSGVVFLIGESDQGPDFTLETKLADNGFGPDQDGLVKAKYGTGNLVDAFVVGASPLNDEDIQGAPTKIIPVKTNVSTKASASIARWNASAYATLYDKNYGQLGNMIYVSVDSAQAEAVPTTSAFTYIPAVGTVNIAFRVNGAAVAAVSLAANRTPTAAVSDIAAASGVLATGGADRLVLQAASVATGTLTVTQISAPAKTCTILHSVAWDVTPTVGDTIVIPNASPIAGAGSANVGAYVVTAASSTLISLTKLSDAGKGGAVIGTVTAPVTTAAIDIASTGADMVGYEPIVISNEAGDPIDGVGKTLEIGELTTGTDLLSRTAFVLGTSGAVTWVSKSGTPKLIVSATESMITQNVSRQTDGIVEDFTVGGEIGLKVSYTGTTATITVSDTAVTSAVAGGSGAALPTINLTHFPTIADLATFINSQTGWKAAPGTAAMGQLPATALDDGTFGCCSQFGEYNGRIKVDAYRYYNKVQGESVLVQVNNPAVQATSGLPKPTTGVTFLSGGTKGVTTAATFTAALAAVEKIRGNFVVPLFSRDASADVTDGLTESGSTYTIAAIHAGVRSHMLKMQKLKQKKNRQGMLSIRDTYANAKEAAATVSNFRCSMSFLDQKVLSASTNAIKQFHPWMDAVIAACGQAAGVYKALVNKQKNINASLQAAGDWDDQDVAQVEDALLNGLLPTYQDEEGAWRYVSDQTTYSANASFVYNSIQATYVSDLIALDSAQKMQKRFTGKALADVGATGALSYLEGLMDGYLSNKWLCKSDDAPLGYKNARVSISGPAMVIDCEVKVDTALYFTPIKIFVSQVTQSASQA